MCVLVALLCACQDGRCFYCDTEFAGPVQAKDRLRQDQWTRDHLFPRSRGGGKGRNIILSCVRCNRLKGDRLPTRDELKRAQAIHVRVERLGKIFDAAFWSEQPQGFHWPKQESQSYPMAAALEGMI